MDGYKWLIPKDGLIIRDPNTLAIIPKEGMMLPVIGPVGRYWNRRVNDGSMTVGKEPIIKKEGIK